MISSKLSSVSETTVSPTDDVVDSVRLDNDGNSKPGGGGGITKPGGNGGILELGVSEEPWIKLSIVSLISSKELSILSLRLFFSSSSGGGGGG